MANFQVAPKLRIVNSADQFEAVKLQLKANGAYEPIVPADTGVPATDLVTDANNTDLYKIHGVADLFRGKIVDGVKTLAIQPQKQVSTLTVTSPTIVNNKEFNIKMKVKTFNLEHEFVRFDGKNSKERNYNLILKTGDTPTIIAARIALAINLDGEKDGYVFATATSAAGVVTVTAENPGWEISFEITGPAIDDANIAVVHAVTAPAFEGRNVYRQMNVKRLQNPNRTYAYAAGHYGAANEVPSPGQSYSSVIVNFEVERTDLSGPEMQNSGPVKGVYGLELYFDEGNPALVLLRDDLVRFIKSTAKVFHEYNATTAAAALVAETPTITTN